MNDLALKTSLKYVSHPLNKYKNEPVDSVIIDNSFVEEYFLDIFGEDSQNLSKKATKISVLKAPYTHIKESNGKVLAANDSENRLNTLIDEKNAIGTGIRHLYLFKNLDFHSWYEVRTSWSAATPADFFLRVHRVLNETEVELNPPTKHGVYSPPYYYVLEIIVQGTGILLYSFDDDESNKQTQRYKEMTESGVYDVPYDVIIEQSMLGLLPVTAVLNAFIFTIVFILGYVLVLPMFLSIFGDKSYRSVPTKED